MRLLVGAGQVLALAVGLAVALVSGLLPAGGPRTMVAQAQVEPNITINFDDAPANRSGSGAAPRITDRYADLGVTFATPVTPLVYDDSSIPAVEGFARSGSTVITTCYSAEFCSNVVDISLDQGHEGAELWVGYGSDLSIAAELVVEGFGPGGLVDQARVTLGPSDAPIPVGTPVRLADPTGTMNRIVVRWADESQFLAGLAIDDLGLTPFEPRIGLQADPAFLFLDGSAGETTGEVAITNVGNVVVGIADAVFEAVSGDPDVTIVETNCPGELAVAATCDVEVAYLPAPGDDAAGFVVAAGRDGATLIAVDVEAVGPAVATDPDPTSAGSTDPGDGATTDTSATPGDTTDGATAAGTSDEDPGTTAGPAGWMVAVAGVLVGGGFVALVGWWRRNGGRTTRRPAAPATPSPASVPHVGIRARPDAGSQVVQPTDGPLISLRARMRPDQARTVLHSPEGG